MKTRKFWPLLSILLLGQPSTSLLGQPSTSSGTGNANGNIMPTINYGKKEFLLCYAKIIFNMTLVESKSTNDKRTVKLINLCHDIFEGEENEDIRWCKCFW